MTYSSCEEKINELKDIPEKTKEGLKKVFLIMNVFYTHEKLYDQMKYKDNKATL